MNKVMTTFSESTYNRAVSMLAGQIVAMVVEDGGDQCVADDYMGDSVAEVIAVVQHKLREATK